MPWVRIDEEFAQHPKLMKVGPLGMALQVAALCYCNKNLTDGFVPWGAARSLIPWEFLGPEEDGGRRCFRVAVTSGMVGEDVTADFVIKLLVDAGLWHEVDGGYMIHDYLDYQPSREQVLAERERNRMAGKASAKLRKLHKRTVEHSVERSVEQGGEQTVEHGVNATPNTMSTQRPTQYQQDSESDPENSCASETNQPSRVGVPTERRHNKELEKPSTEAKLRDVRERNVQQGVEHSVERSVNEVSTQCQTQCQPDPDPVPNSLEAASIDRGSKESIASDLERGLGRTQQPPSQTQEIPEVTFQERLILLELRKVKGYPFDYEKDLAYIRTLAVDYPDVDLLKEVKKWATHKLDHPFKRKANPRLSLRNWCENAHKWKARDVPAGPPTDEDLAQRLERIAEV